MTNGQLHYEAYELARIVASMPAPQRVRLAADLMERCTKLPAPAIHELLKIIKVVLDGAVVEVNRLMAISEAVKSAAEPETAH